MDYACDFETTTNEDDCRVWAWGAVEIDESLKFTWGNNIDSFFKNFMRVSRDFENTKIFFHNAKFDCEFIFYWLFKNGYVHTNEKRMQAGEFTTLITDMGTFFQMKICYHVQGKHRYIMTIQNSLNLINSSVERIAKDYKFPITKGEIDYNKPRPVNYYLQADEVDYLRRDCEIIARALLIFKSQALTKMTIASNALDKYKKTYFKNDCHFLDYFPQLDSAIDTFCRNAYKGGYTYCSPRTQHMDIADGLVFDVNSLYPSVMSEKMLPYGKPEYYEGDYIKNADYPLYIQRFSCSFELKNAHLPTLQLKNNSRFLSTEYLKSSGGDVIEITLTSVDLKLFFEHYNVYDFVPLDGFMFQGRSDLFTDYIDYWNNEKIQAQKENNPSGRAIAKLMLNSLYGKFGTSPKANRKTPFLHDNESIGYTTERGEMKDTIYIPIASFITAWARYKTITTAQSLYDRFLYADTDSLHLSGLEMPNIEIDKTELGKWCHESTFTRARFIGQKRYIEEINGEIHVTCASMPARVHKYVTFDNFHVGTVFAGETFRGKLDYEYNVVYCKECKLRPKHVRGGIVLVETPLALRTKL